MLAALAVVAANPAGAAEQHHVQAAICKVFKGRLCGQALRVAYCESRYNIHAKNGQYLGIFQMGSHERRTFGHGNTPLAQARAARRYFDYSVRVNGYGWKPWSCRWAA